VRSASTVNQVKRRITEPNEPFRAVDFNSVSVAAPLRPGGVQRADPSLVVAREQEAVVLATGIFPDVISRMTGHSDDVAKEEAHEVDHMDAIVHEGAASRDRGVVHPGVRELRAAGMTMKSSDVIELADFAVIEELPGQQCGSRVAQIETCGECFPRVI